MQFAFVLLLGTFLNVGIQAVTAKAIPEWKCRVCEDAFQTWHDRFPCLGSKFEKDYSLTTLSEGMEMCKDPLLRCGDIEDEIKRKACFAMLRELRRNPQLSKEVWEGLMTHGNNWDVCNKIGKCPDRKLAEECVKIFESPNCKSNPLCDGFAVCEEPCYLCVWLTKYLPLFQEICKPRWAYFKGKKENDGAGFYGLGKDKKKVYTGLKSSKDKALEPTAEFAAFQVTPDYTIGYENGPRDDAELMDACFEAYEYLEGSYKGRYFAALKQFVTVRPDAQDAEASDMWDANTACKCAGKCELKPFESLGLIETCRYDQSTENYLKQFVFKGPPKFEDEEATPPPPVIPGAPPS
eukprot:GILJ01002905.1.p1 GENE.GILJ01002905.1~~GILJ01002905.1.p1  ORF type:complete len:351 (-),score=30.82 GILJ01002905.1:139-1191(-)